MTKISNSIFIYNGEGANTTCVDETTQLLNEKYGKKYSVLKVDSSYMAKESSPSLYVLPGGQALIMGFAIEKAAKKIQDCVRTGSGILGFCAGAMAMSSSWEYLMPTNTHPNSTGIFESDTLHPLNFGPYAFGPTFFDGKGSLNDIKPCIAKIHLPIEHKSFKCFWNQGCIFRNLTKNDVSIAEYETVSSINSLIKEKTLPAVIHSHYGHGNSIFLGIHPELAPWSKRQGYLLSEEDLTLNDYLFETSCRLAGLSL